MFLGHVYNVTVGERQVDRHVISVTAIRIEPVRVKQQAGLDEPEEWEF